MGILVELKDEMLKWKSRKAKGRETGRGGKGNTVKEGDRKR